GRCTSSPRRSRARDPPGRMRGRYATGCRRASRAPCRRGGRVPARRRCRGGWTGWGSVGPCRPPYPTTRPVLPAGRYHSQAAPPVDNGCSLTSVVGVSAPPQECVAERPRRSRDERDSTIARTTPPGCYDRPLDLRFCTLSTLVKLFTSSIPEGSRKIQFGPAS